MKTILFVCTENTCRSPMAKALFDRKTDFAYRTDSAGLSAKSGSPASNGATASMNELGLNIASHKSKRFSAAMMGDIALVVPMTPTHAYILLQYGVPADKIFVLGEQEGIFDPYGGGLAEYLDCAGTIDKALDDLQAMLTNGLSSYGA